MDDIFTYVREGNPFPVRAWLDDTEHDLNEGDDHGFSPLHWAAKCGHAGIADVLVRRGARVSATNMGDDTPLHLAAAHGHRTIVQMLIKQKADVNFINEHGNTALHYACFWGYQSVADDLVHAGALVTVANRYEKMPLDYCSRTLASRLHELAAQTGQDLQQRVQYRDQSWLTIKTRSRDATMSRHKGIPIEQLNLHTRTSVTPQAEVWRGRWQGNAVESRLLVVRECSARVVRDFSEQFPRLRIFSHVNIAPVLGCCVAPPRLVVVCRAAELGTLYQVVHGDMDGVLVDTARALSFAIDVARGMRFLHTFEKNVPNYHLNSHHVVVDEDMTAKLSMADAQFTFQNRAKVYHPQWFSPEALQKSGVVINRHAADMWSFAVLLWELVTRDVPFGHLSPMEAGMKIATEGLRCITPPGISSHLSRLISICMNEQPNKRPSFDQIVPILERMVGQ